MIRSHLVSLLICSTRCQSVKCGAEDARRRVVSFGTRTQRLRTGGANLCRIYGALSVVTADKVAYPLAVDFG